MMPIDRIPDWEQRIARQDAFWDRAILDRPVVSMQWPKVPPAVPTRVPQKHASWREHWMDTDRVVNEALAVAANTEYGGDALPHFWPNLGPEVFSAFFGLEMTYTETTSWARPIIEDWSHIGHIRFSEDNFYWKKLLEMTDALLEAGKNRFYVGFTDIHTGGDAIAAFRDPIDLNTDLLVCPKDVKRLLAYVNETYVKVYNFYYAKLLNVGQPICSWAGIVSTKKWYVPSNDFSCMISNAMFEEFFLPGIAAECRFLEASIYHLDGPNALRHLDSLLAIPELNAIQWIYGEGHGRASDWLPVYQRCQQAGKGIQLGIDLDELDTVIEHLRPEGVWMSVAVRNRDEADAVLRRVSKWT